MFGGGRRGALCCHLAAPPAAPVCVKFNSLRSKVGPPLERISLTLDLAASLEPQPQQHDDKHADGVPLRVA